VTTVRLGHTGLWVNEHDCGLPGSIGGAKIVTPSSLDSYLVSKMLQPSPFQWTVACVCVCVCVLYSLV